MREIEKKLRKVALDLSYRCQDGNLQSVFSCIDFLWILYDEFLKWNPDIATSPNRDYLIVSKGQATLALYPILIEKGFFDLDELKNEIGDFNSRYSIQTDITKFDGGIENNAGSLGHGLPFAVGIAMGKKIQKLDSKIFVLCGDGEFCEGTMWESLLIASEKHLDNLFVIIDDNDSVKTMISINEKEKRFESFGFDVFSFCGHNYKETKDAISKALTLNNCKPKILIAHTKRGYGSDTMMNNDIWFHKSPSSLELEMLKKEIDFFDEKNII